MKLAITALAVLLVVVAVSAKPQKGDKSGSKEEKDGLGRIKPVNPKMAQEFKDKVQEMITDCQSTIAQASTIASEAVGLAGDELKNKMKSVGQMFIGLQNKIQGSMMKGQLLIMRSFLAGFKDEHICKDISMKDLEDEEDEGAIDSTEVANGTPNPVMKYFSAKRGFVSKRAIEATASKVSSEGKSSEELSDKDRPLVCLMKNIGNMMKRIMEVSEEIEQQALTTSAPGECDAMTNYINEAIAGTVTPDKQTFITHVATDLACMSTRVNFFVERIKEKASTIDMTNPKEVRSAMLRMFIVFCGMVDNARDTVMPVFEFIESEYPEMAAEIEAALNSQESGESSIDEGIVGSGVAAAAPSKRMIMKMMNLLKHLN